MPYNPQMDYKGSDYLFQGISQAGAKMGSAVEDVIKKYKQTQDAGKAGDYFYKALGDQAPMVTGIHEEKWKTLGADDKAQAMVGFIQAQGAKKAQMEQQDMAAQIAQRNATAQHFQDEAQRKNAEDEGMATIFQGLQQGAGGGSAPQLQPGAAEFLQQHGIEQPPAVPQQPGRSVQDVIGALANSGKLNPRVQAAIARQMLPQMMGTGTAEDLSPGSYKDPTTGAVFAYRGKQFLPAGFDPAVVQQATKPVPQHDDEGNLIGWTETDMKGRSTFRAFKGGGKLAPAIDQDGNPIQNFYMTADGKVVDARSAIQKMTGKVPGAATAKKLDQDTAKQFLKQAKGDKDKARELAKQAGYTF